MHPEANANIMTMVKDRSAALKVIVIDRSPQLKKLD
jgi:hypothetical protein